MAEQCPFARRSVLFCETLKSRTSSGEEDRFFRGTSDAIFIGRPSSWAKDSASHSEIEHHERRKITLSAAQPAAQRVIAILFFGRATCSDIVKSAITLPITLSLCNYTTLEPFCQVPLIERQLQPGVHRIKCNASNFAASGTYFYGVIATPLDTTTVTNWERGPAQSKTLPDPKGRSISELRSFPNQCCRGDYIERDSEPISRPVPSQSFQRRRVRLGRMHRRSRQPQLHQ